MPVFICPASLIWCNYQPKCNCKFALAPIQWRWSLNLVYSVCLKPFGSSWIFSPFHSTWIHWGAAVCLLRAVLAATKAPGLQTAMGDILASFSHDRAPYRCSDGGNSYKFLIAFLVTCFMWRGSSEKPFLLFWANHMDLLWSDGVGSIWVWLR